MKQISQISEGGIGKNFWSTLFNSSIPNTNIINQSNQISSTQLKSNQTLRILPDNEGIIHQNNSFKAGVNSNEIFKSSEEKEIGMAPKSCPKCFFNYFYEFFHLLKILIFINLKKLIGIDNKEEDSLKNSEDFSPDGCKNVVKFNYIYFFYKK